jgi:hypothetical protein
MTHHAKGSFEVKLAPMGAENKAGGSSLGRMSIDKAFHGDLEATSQGEMLTAGTDVGSAVYVAIERVTGVLNGRSGSFVLVHNGVMTAQTRDLSITVAPDSGSGDLVGLKGTLGIEITDGRHYYDFDYSL